MKEAGSIVTFDLRGGAPAAARFVDALELFSLTPSLGATESLVVAPQMMTVRDFSPEQRRISGIEPGTVRLAMGLEDGEDLAADVAHALEVSGA
jgi:cystathionine beta-lyase/cystathionine gamma-synthase